MMWWKKPGDYESMKQVTRIGPGGTLSYRADLPRGQNSSANQADVTRTVLAGDLLSAHDYSEHFGPNDPQTYPGTAAISASREVLAELKTSGHTNFRFRRLGGAATFASVVSDLAGLAGMNAKDTRGAAWTVWVRRSAFLSGRTTASSHSLFC
jgi:hypothetical protein